MAQSSETKLNKRFDQNIEVTGSLQASYIISDPATSIASSGNYNWVHIGPYGSGADRAAALQIGDIDGARYAVATGGYDLTFMKHVANTDTWANALKLTASDANDSTVNTTIYGNLTINGSLSLSGYNAANWNTAYGWGDHAGLYAPVSHTHSYLPLSGGIVTGTVTINGSNGLSRLRIEGTTPTIDLDDSDGDSFYIHVNSNNFYILNDRDGGGNYGDWEPPYALQLEADTNVGYVFGNTIIHSGNIGSQSVSYASSAGSAGNATEAYALDVADTRAAQRMPTDVPEYRVSAEFTNQITSGWHSVLNVKGWHDGYATWQLIGGSDTSTHTNLWFRSGVGSSWGNLNKIWHSGNDGSGSGLDADRLDGVEASNFVRSDVDDTITGDLLINTGATQNGIRFRTTNGDFVGRYSDYVSLYNQTSGGEIRMYDSDYIILDSPDVRVAGNHQVIHGGNIGSQSVSYANSAGTVTGTGLGADAHGLTAFTSATHWSKPAGYQTMIRADQTTGDPGGQNYYGYTITSRRDTGTGYSALLTGYNNNDLWFTYNNTETNYPTWRRIWTEVNDGSGSGLDADLLDGLQGSQFLRSDTEDTTNSRLNISVGSAQEGLVVTGEYPQVTIRRTSIPDASIHYDAGYAKKWNVGPGAGGAEEDEFGFAIYSAPRGTHYGTPMRINAETQNVMIGDADHPSFKLDVRGTIRSTADIRGTIFYDENNTGYYIDAASTSNINTVDYSTLRARNSTNGGRFVNVADWGTRHYTNDGYIHFGPANSGHAHIYTDRSNFYFNKLLQVNGVSTINTNDIKTKIYYDWDDTGYYIDPSSSNISARLNGDIYMTGGKIHVKRGTGLTTTAWEDDSTANGRAQLILDSHYSDLIIASRNANTNRHGSTLTFATQSTTDSSYAKWVIGQGQWQEGRDHLSFAYGENQANPHSTLGTDNANYDFQIRNGGSTYSSGSSRAPIFYDSNNTGYYCDPNGTSRFYNTDYGNGGTSRNGAVAIGLGDGSLHFRSMTDYNHKMWYYDGLAFSTNPSHGHIRFYADSVQRNASTGGSYLRFDIDCQNAITTAHGTFKCTGDIIAYSSDARLKENLRPIENPIEKLKSIRGVIYDWKDVIDDHGFKPRNRKDDVGVIAQEVEAVMPQVVTLAPFDTEMDDEKEIPISKSGENYKTVQYEKLVPLLIEAIKEQQDQIDELKKLINP